ncbi:MAG: L-aspartate oxidase, partial [Deltaproteobacteria bacterium]|nr:L-aspartate oxidase [Deltaproteobacteria bacterium]
MKTDFLIIGSGIAGLRTAIELGNHGDVLIVTKDRSFESSSSYAQGGIAVVIGEDDTTDYHIEDTLRAGGGLCRERAVRVLVEEGPRLVDQLIKWGARFDKSDGEFLTGLEGAHSRRRILHFKDSTGGEIVRVLREKALENPNISKLPKHFVIDLLIRGDRCVGAILLNEENGKIFTVMARATILATGGAGQVYLRTSNPHGATGDGIATAYRSGAILVDMEFVQFHPTTFALPGAPSFLITEALRGEGAVLRNINGRRFMPDYHPLEELAPRDELSRAILNETIKSGGDYVLLDATHIKTSLLKERFLTAYTTCLRYGIDITRDMIPVSPGAHFIVGGVDTDTWGRTSINGLFAAGEVACTGVHGANRLASNSLLEGLVFGARAGMAASEYAQGYRIPPGIRPKASDIRIGRQGNTSESLNASKVSSIREEIREMMWDKVGIVRSGVLLEEALKDIDLLISAIDG